MWYLQGSERNKLPLRGGARIKAEANLPLLKRDKDVVLPSA